MPGPALAKPYLDVGLFTNDVEKLASFYGQVLGLPFEGVLRLPPLAPLGGEVEQHRYDLRGSVLKINHCVDGLPDACSGYRALIVASQNAAEPRAFTDPDGLDVTVVPVGHDGVTDVAVAYSTVEPDALGRFLQSALGGTSPAPGRYQVGNTVLFVEEDHEQPRAEGIRARGFTYVTVHVKDVVAAHRQLLDLGVDVVTAPARVGDVSAVCFVRDPAGNWVELAQRASLVGWLPDLPPPIR